MRGDAITVARQLNKVLLDNDRVRVLEARVKPGVKSSLHTHRVMSVSHQTMATTGSRYLMATVSESS